MKLKLNFSNNNYIVIEIFQENSLWFDFFKDRKDNNQYFPVVDKKSLCWYTPIIKKSFFLNYILPSYRKHSSNLKMHWSSIKQNTEYLKSQNFKIPYDLSEEFNYDQQLLNTIHRFFTYNSLWAISDCKADMSGDTPLTCLDIPNPFDPSFIPKDLKGFFTAINNLNMTVHQLEIFCTTTNKDMILGIIKGDQEIHVGVKNNHEFTNRGWTYFGNKLDEFQKSYSNRYPDVILSEEIQGKSYLRAFIDNDDPTQLDITGRYGSYGGFVIDVYEDRKHIYNSKEFNTWLESYGLKKENLLLEHPLGQVIDSSIPLTDFDETKFIDIDFIDD